MGISREILEIFACDLLIAGGFSQNESAITSKSLILSNLMGHDSHGIMRVQQYVQELKHGTLRSGAKLDILHETATSLHADAGQGLGQVQMNSLLDHLFQKIEKNACISGVLCNSGHVGRLGEWVEAAAEKNYAAFMAVNDNGTYQIVAPAGGIEARTSTNPIAFALPLRDDVFSIDLSTSATAMGKLRLSHLAGETVDEGLIQDHQGNATTDPSCLFTKPKGSILPFGGYKGFALSMMVDCLVSGLSGGFTPPAPEKAPAMNNVMITLWNPAYFAGIEHMKLEAEKYLAYVRESKPANVEFPVRVPGERAKTVLKDRLKNGVPVEENLRQALIRFAQSLNVNVPEELKV